MRLGQGERGYAMAALLVGLSVMAVLMTMAMPVWSHFAKREKEEELIWRGQQYARAIGLFQRKFANTFPPNVDVLVEQKFLRKKYKDPITKDDFQPIPAGGGVPNQPGGTGTRKPGQSGLPKQGTPAPGGGPTSFIKPFAVVDSFQEQPSIGIQGVVSKSTESSIKIYNGRSKYNEWTFVYLATSQRIGPPGGPQKPGAPGQPQPGQSPFGPGIPGGVPTKPPAPSSPFGKPQSQPQL